MKPPFLTVVFHYRGEPTPYNWPNVVSNFGLYDLCGFRKDLSYLFEASWSDHDVLHVFPHWNWEDTGKDSIDVWVISFGPGKKLNIGEGAMVLTNDLKWYEKLLKYQHPERQMAEISLNESSEFYPINGRISPLSAIVLKHYLNSYLVSRTIHLK